MKSFKYHKDNSSTTSKYFNKPKAEKSCVQQQNVGAPAPSCSERLEKELSQYTKIKLRSFAYTDEQDNKAQVEGGSEDIGEKHMVTPLVTPTPSTSNRCIQLKEHCDSHVLESDSPSPSKQTQLQQQFLSLKNQYPTVLLFIECGYKYHFFEEDAEIASKHLNISCYKYHNFKTASIPTQTLYLHVRRLVFRGFKVGIVKQIEAAALKSISETKNSLFERKLTAIYTKSTLIGEDLDTKNTIYDDEFKNADISKGYLVCLFEETVTKKGKDTQFGVIAARPVTGDVSYCFFEDGKTRDNLQQFLSTVQAVEIILPEKVTIETSHFIQYLSRISKDEIRVEHLSQDLFAFDKAIENVSEFTSLPPDELIKLPPPVLRALSAIFEYLKDFGLQKILKELRFMKPLELYSNEYVRLNYTTKRNLCIFGNYQYTSGKNNGSLFKLFDRTLTAFGSRTLKEWMENPLKNYSDIIERQSIVETILNDSNFLQLLREMLYNNPDLEYLLCSVYYHKCSPFQLLTLLKSLNAIRKILSNFCVENVTNEIKSIFPFLDEILNNLEMIPQFLANLNEDAARTSDKSKLFNDISVIPGYCELQLQIDQVHHDLDNHKLCIASVLGISEFEYTSSIYAKYTIEVPNHKESIVPMSWRKISMTKLVSRYRSPEADLFSQKLVQLEEQKNNICESYWNEFLDVINTSFFSLKKVISHLAKLDCYFSLAEFTKQDGYVKPKILNVENETIFHIEGGRHPIIEKCLTDDAQFVANNLHLDNENKCIILTGPNMGGKSTFIKQVGLIALLAQIGSYVPAEKVVLTPVDAIHIRMGCTDNMMENQSTFYVEALETYNILQDATSKSLVLFDELGCGTSTHDGMAIAYATLHHLLHNVECLTLFVTHYMQITDLALRSQALAKNTHVSFTIDESDDERKIYFLYKLSEGTSKESFGMNVARLASLPQSIINHASIKARFFEDAIYHQRKRRKLFKDFMAAKFENLREVIMSFKSDNLEQSCLD